MTDDERILRDHTIEITDAENVGNRDRLAAAIAPQLAFQRADAAKTVDNRDTFLAKVSPGGDRRVTQIIEPIEIYGSRAVVLSVVTAGGRQFHNLRLFVKRDGDWKLLGWANEELPLSQSRSASSDNA